MELQGSPLDWHLNNVLSEKEKLVPIIAFFLLHTYEHPSDV